MLGNIYEWVQDEWHDNYYGAPNDGRGWCTGDCPVNASDPNYTMSDQSRVLRGANWYLGAPFTRATLRSSNRPASESGTYGGRLSRSIP